MNQNILITGANKGIGFCLTTELLNAGYSVIAISKNIDRLTTIKSNRLKILQADLQNYDDVTNLICTLQEANIEVHVLINNAGIGIFDQVENISHLDWHSVINLNLNVPFYFIKYVLPIMKQHNYGRIINIGSNADSEPEAFAAAYCASKYGLLALAQCTSLETKGYNISVTTISPGRVDTYFNGKHPGCRPNALQPIDVVKQVLFILSMDDRCEIQHIKLQSSKE